MGGEGAGNLEIATGTAGRQRGTEPLLRSYERGRNSGPFPFQPAVVKVTPSKLRTGLRRWSPRVPSGTPAMRPVPVRVEHMRAAGRSPRSRALAVGCSELLQRGNVPCPQCDVLRCLVRSRSAYQSLASTESRVNRARKRWVVHRHPFVLPVRHDVQQRLQRRARGLDAAVLEIVVRHPALARRRSRPRPRRTRPGPAAPGRSISSGNTASGVSKMRPRKWSTKRVRDAVAEPAGEHRPAVDARNPRASPDIRSGSGTRDRAPPRVMRHQISGTSMLMSWSTRMLRADVPGGRGEAGVAREDHARPARCSGR